MYLFSSHEPVALMKQFNTTHLFSTNFHGALQSVSSLFQCVCNPFCGRDVPRRHSASYPGSAHSRGWHLCTYAAADTPHILENFFFNDVIQRKRLIWVGLRQTHWKWCDQNGSLACFFDTFLVYSRVQRPLGVLAQAEDPAVPTSCPKTRNIRTKTWQGLPQAAAHKPGCSEQDFLRPRQILPSPSQAVASWGSIFFYFPGYDCFLKMAYSWLDLFLIP